MGIDPNLYELQGLEYLSVQFQVWFAVFTMDTLRYLIAGTVTSLILYKWLKAWSQSRKIQTRKATSADIRREVFYSLLTTSIYAFVAVFVVYGISNGHMKVYENVADMGWLYTALSLPVMLLLHDTYFYFAHRSMHHPKLFKWFHKVHHLSRTPTPWAAYSFSPGEAFVMSAFVPFMLWAVPIHGAVLFTFVAIQILRNAQGHSGIEFHHHKWVDSPLDIFTTTTHHDLHHQKVKGNYGLYFTWWDRIMGTELPGYKAEFRRIVSGTEEKQSADLDNTGSISS